MNLFEEQYEKYEELAKQAAQAYDFWANCILSSWKEFFKVK